jgi:hypothetical protein
MSILLRVERMMPNGQESDLWFLMENASEEAYNDLASMATGNYYVYSSGSIIEATTQSPVYGPRLQQWLVSAATGQSYIAGLVPINTPYTIPTGPVYVFTLNVKLMA